MNAGAPRILLGSLLLVGLACDGGSRSAGGEPASALDSLHAHGEALYAGGEIDSARVVFEHELSLARSTRDSIAVGRSLTWLAQAAWRLGDYAATRRLGEEALAVKLRAGGDLFSSYNILGLLAWNEARPLDAIELFEKATAAAEASGDSVNLAKVWNNRGLVATSLGNYEDARSGFLAARETARAIDDPLIEGRSLINLAMLALEVGDPAAALEHLAEARPRLAEAEDVVGEQILLGHVGTAYAASGNPGRAIAHLDSALVKARVNGLRQEEAINMEQLAELHRDAGNHRRALALLAAAAAINEELGLVDEQGIDLRLEARIHAELGNRGLAVQKARRALEIHRESGARLEELSDLVVLAELSQEAAAVEDAGIYLNQADELANDLGIRSARAEAALGRARVADRAGSAERALRALTSIEDDVPALGYAVEWETEALRARALVRAGRLADAADAGRRSIAALERVRGRFGSGWLRAAYLRSRGRVYGDLVDTLLRLGRVEEAFLVSDASRGRLLLEHVGTTRPNAARAEGARDLGESERLLGRIHELGARLDEVDRLAMEEPDLDLTEQARRLTMELEKVRGEYEAAVVRAEERDPRLAALTGTSPEGIAGARRTLVRGEALLEYMVLDDRLLVFVVDRDAVVVAERPIAREELATQVRIARELVGQPNGKAGSANLVLERLHGLLLRPALEAGALRGIDRLVIVPHAELEYLPFAALRDPGTGRYLVQDHVIAHAPSLRSLAVLRQGSREAGMRRPAEGTAFAPFPEGLPASRSEVEAFGQAVARSRVHRGKRATEGRLRRALAGQGVVHVASHGILNARNPMFSRIELVPGRDFRGGALWRDDGRLEVHEVLDVPIESRLVFLSGCETGGGAAWSTGYDRGSDSSTLAQAFLFAGARSVVATLWPVVDRGAASFAVRFYSAWNGRSPTEALALAQRSMLEDPRYRSPYHWAGYRISGG